MTQDMTSSPWRNRPVVVMTAGGTNPRLVINELARHFPALTVIEEQPESKGLILRRRARRLGWIEACGQLATMIASRLGKRFATRRTEEIIAQYRLNDAVDAAIPVIAVSSLNDAACHDAVRAAGPAVIFTISCRILSAKTLAAMPCPVINFHAGINPAYRGQMGGYWALVENDAGNFGGTVHVVDAGIDTGGTLYEKRATPSKSDTMLTYPLLLSAASIDIIIRSIDDALAGRLAPYAPAGQSKLRYNPAIWTWLWHGLTKRIW